MRCTMTLLTLTAPLLISCSGGSVPNGLFVHFAQVSPRILPLPGTEDAIEIHRVLHDGRMVGTNLNPTGDAAGDYIYDPEADTFTLTTGIPMGVVNGRLIGQAPNSGLPLDAWSDDGVDWTVMPYPDDLARVDDMDFDPYAGLIYASGLADMPLPTGGDGYTGAVRVSADFGETWEPFGGIYAPPGGSPQGDTITCGLGNVLGGRVKIATCDVVVDGCVFYTTDGETTNQSTENDNIDVIGVAADGSLIHNQLAGSSFIEAFGRLSADMTASEDIETLYSSFMPYTWRRTMGMTLDGTLWVSGQAVDGEDWLWRTTEPVGPAHDQQRAVLGGPGCTNFFDYDRGNGSGRTIDFSFDNTGDERLYVADVFGEGDLQPWPQDGVGQWVDPGESYTDEIGEDEVTILLTADGRCRGFGPARKLNGRRFD